MPKETQDDVRAESAAVCKMRREWKLIEDLMGGTEAMRCAGPCHLPKWPAEQPLAYENRRRSAVLFPAYPRTVSILAGKPFSKQATIGEDAPSRIRELADDIDAEGRNLHAFASELCHEALAYGLCGILVDHPPSLGAKTVKDEKAAGLRPYFVMVKHDQFLGWRSEAVKGGRRLTQLRILETVEEPHGDFGTRCVEQVRVLEPGLWSVYRKDEKTEEWVVVDEGTTAANGAPLDEIPFVPIYGFREDFMVGRPPMLDLAYLNVEHWQSQSDQQTILHVARVPLLFVKNMKVADGFVVGASGIITSEDERSEVGFVEHSGAAIEAGRQSLIDLEDRMRQVGAELMVVKSANASDAQTLAEDEPGRCDLQRIVQSLEDGIDRALYFMAQFLGLPDGGHVEIFDDFGIDTIQNADASLLVDMTSKGMLTNATLLDELKQRGKLSPDLDVEAELKALANESAAAPAAVDVNAAQAADATGSNVPTARKPGGDTGAGRPQMNGRTAEGTQK